MYEDGSFKSINEKLFKMEIEANDDNREIAETTEDTQVSDDLIVLLERFRNELSDVGQELASFYAEYKEKEDLGKITRPEKISIFLNIADQITSSLEKANFDGFGKSVVESIQKFHNEIKTQLSDIAENFDDLISSIGDDNEVELQAAEDTDMSEREIKALARQQNENFDIFTKRLRVEDIMNKTKQILALLKSKLLNYQQNASNAPIDALYTPTFVPPSASTLSSSSSYYASSSSASSSASSSDTSSLSGSGRARKNMFLDLGPYQNKQKLIV
jgi:hypothetical protein